MACMRLSYESRYFKGPGQTDSSEIPQASPGSEVPGPLWVDEMLTTVGDMNLHHLPLPGVLIYKVMPDLLKVRQHVVL